MVQYSVSEFKKGLKVIIEGDPHVIVEADFKKPGKGQAIYRTKFRNLIRGTMLERVYRSGDKLDAADVNEQTLEYVYNDTKSWVFMDQETFEQYPVLKANLGGAEQWMKEGMHCAVVFWNGQPMTVDPPNQVELAVTYCEPAARGNTATNVQKPATLETGAEISVPAFINNGDVVKVDTRTGEYIERVTKG